MKSKVFNAAFSSAILYACGSWLAVSLNPVEKLYTAGVRSLLGVRKSIPLLRFLIEAGLPSVEALVKDRQSKFMSKVMSQRQDIEKVDPLCSHLMQ